MDLNENNIKELSDSFIATFLSAALKAKKIPFMEICLSFVYASKKILISMRELKMLSQEQLNIIEESLFEAANDTIKLENNQKLVKILDSMLEEEKNGRGSEQEQ
jgi:hypothetical protein